MSLSARTLVQRSLRRRLAAGMSTKIHYTHTDEAPMLATYALLPM